MSKKDNLQELEIINEDAVLEVSEDSISEVDGEHILARVTGPTFFPGTTSGNGMFYPEEAWESTLNRDDFKNRLQNRMVLGGIGHKNKLDDLEVAEGKASHICTKLWVNEENIGMGEYLILNTDSGRNLNTLLRAGARMSVSTKAKAVVENKSGRKQVRPGKFFLERVDFVVNPGYDQAVPTVVESIDDEQDNLIEENNMSETTTNEEYIAHLKSELDATKAGLAAVQEELKVSGTVDVEEMNELRSELSDANEALGAYEAMGTVDEVQEALQAASDTITSMKETIEENRADAGSLIGENKDAIELAEHLNEYLDLGSVSDIKELVEESDKAFTSLMGYRVKDIAESAGVAVTVVESMVDKGIKLDDVLGIITMVTESEDGDDGDDDKMTDDEKKAKKKKAEESRRSTKDFKNAKDVDESIIAPTVTRLRGLMHG